MPDANDMDLVREFARANSEPAFAELVRRHINLVYSVAWRYVGNAQDAQDVTQAVFIILTQKAAKLRRYIVLTGWLYETTRFTALRFLRTKTRRHFREQEAYMQSTPDESDTDNVWRQLAPLLEEAMTRLNEKERTLLALRFFENRTGAETAALLGMEEWAGRKRADRALEKLRKFFTQRGVMLSTSAIAGAVSANSVQAAPVGLAKTISAVAIAKGAAAGGSTLALAKGTLKVMAWTKAKTVIAVGIGVLLAGGTTLIIHHHTQPVSSAKSADEEKAIAISKMDAAKQFVVGMLMYAHDHQAQVPTSFDQMASYFKNDPNARSNMDQFEIVYQGSLANIADPNSTIVVMEKKPWLTSHGTLAKTYGFADGHTAIRVAPFEPFEHTHMISPPNQ